MILRSAIDWRGGGLAVRTRVMAAALALGALCVTNATSNAAVAATKPASTMATFGRGNGELAVISDGRLRLVDNDGSSYVVAGPGQPSQPSWSADGKWVAFLRTPATPVLQSPVSTLWMARPMGPTPTALAPPVRTSSSSPGDGRRRGRDSGLFGNLFAVLRVRGALPGHRVPVPPRRFATYADLIGFSWAPSGSALAVSYRKGPRTSPERAKASSIYPRSTAKPAEPFTLWRTTVMSSWPAGGPMAKVCCSGTTPPARPALPPTASALTASTSPRSR